jgi:hypothetical protein
VPFDWEVRSGDPLVWLCGRHKRDPQFNHLASTAASDAAAASGVGHERSGSREVKRSKNNQEKSREGMRIKLILGTIGACKTCRFKMSKKKGDWGPYWICHGAYTPAMSGRINMFEFTHIFSACC